MRSRGTMITEMSHWAMWVGYAVLARWLDSASIASASRWNASVDPPFLSGCASRESSRYARLHQHFFSVRGHDGSRGATVGNILDEAHLWAPRRSPSACSDVLKKPRQLEVCAPDRVHIGIDGDTQYCVVCAKHEEAVGLIVAA